MGVGGLLSFVPLCENVDMVTGSWTDLFLMLVVGDRLSTNLALNNGAVETNLLYDFLTPKLGAAVGAVEMALALGLVLVIRRLRPQWLGVFQSLCLGFSIVVANNLALAFIL